MTRLSAIVPATDDPPTLERCVAAIRAADEPPEELIVVDSADGAGPAAARNEGAERASGEVLVFVDADVIVHADAFRRIRAAFEDEPGLTALFGAYDDEPEAPGLVARFRNLLHHHVHASAEGPASTFWAGLGAVRKDAFDAVGGFDARRYPLPSVEDIDLGTRIGAVGGRIRLDPRVCGTHLKAWSLGGMVQTDFARRGVPWVELLLRRGASSTALNLGWRHRLSSLAALAALGGVVTRRPRTAAVAVVGMAGLNARFYALLARKQGPAQAAAGVGLHAVHHLTGVAALPVGVARHLGVVGRQAVGAGEPLELEPFEDLDAAGGEWPELAERAGNLFTSWEWASTWWRHYGQGRRLLLVACREPDGRLVAILPLYLASSKPVRTLRLVGNGAANQLGLVCAPEERPRAARGLRRFLERPPVDWDVFLADDLPGDEGWDLLVGATPVRRSTSPVVRGEWSDWDDYLNSRSRNFRRQLGKSERRLARDHELRYRLTDDAARLEDDLDAFFDLHRARWGAEANVYASREPFHRELARLSFERGRLRLWFLELDGRPAAASLGHRFGGAAWLEQAGRDPAFEHESVGSILRAHVIRDAIEDGVRDIKLLRGDQPHKLRFATADPGVVTIGLGRGLVGHAALAGACALPLLPAAPQRVLARLAGQDLGADPRLG